MPLTAGNKKERTQERREGPTPNGGAYSLLNFLDATWKPVTRERAAMVEVVEYSAEGAILKCTIVKKKPAS